MSHYQEMVKNIISSLESLDVLENDFSDIGIELNDGDLRERIKDVFDVIYDLEDMLESGEDCNSVFMEISEIWDDISISEDSYPYAIQELEDGIYDLRELGNKTGCLVLSKYLDRYKDVVDDVVKNIFVLDECIKNSEDY